MGTVILPPSPNWYASHLADVGPGLHAFCAHNSIVVLDSGGTQVCDVLKGHSNRTTAVAFVHDDDDPTSLWIVSASSDKNVRLWICTNLQQGTFSCRRSLGKRPAEVKAIAATSRVAIVGDTAGNLFIWKVSTSPERMQRLEHCHQRSSITCVACSPRPEHPVAAVGCSNGEVALIDWEKGTVLSVLRHHSVEVHCLRWSHLGIEDIDEINEKIARQQQLPNSVELLVSAAPGERLRIYETRLIGDGACACLASTSDAGPTESENVVASLGNGREIALVGTLQHPKPPGNLAQGQRQRLWLSADWLPAPALRRHSNRTIDIWMLTSGYGGGILARRVLLLCKENETLNKTGALLQTEGEITTQEKLLVKDEVEEEAPVRLPGGHSRTVFSVRCMLDLSREEPGVRILTIGMDRAAMSFWAPVPRLHRNFHLSLEAEAKISRQTIISAENVPYPAGSLVPVDSGDGVMSAACEAERKSWQRTELVGIITGLGSFPQAFSLSSRRLYFQQTSSGSSVPPKFAVGCGDGSIRILPFQQTSHPVTETFSETTELKETSEVATTSDLQQQEPVIPVSVELDTRSSTLIWQGIPAAVTAVLWHPTENSILAFGCSDGSVGLAHSGKGTAILAMSKHKAGISHIAWILEPENEEKEDKDEVSNGEIGVEKEEDFDQNSETSEKEEEKSFKSCRLLTLSSDGSLFQWNSWSKSSLSDLFPTTTKQQQQGSASAAAVKPRTELGRPSPFPLSFSSGEGRKDDVSPTCLDPGEGGLHTVIGSVDGSVVRIEQGGCLLKKSSSSASSGVSEGLSSSVEGAAVVYVATCGQFYAAFHTDKTLEIGDFSENQLKPPRTINIGSKLAAAVTSMAFISEEKSMSFALKKTKEEEEEEKTQRESINHASSSPSIAVYVALGLQDGSIQIWSLNDKGAEKQKEAAEAEQEEEEKHEEEEEGSLVLLTVLRGHAGSVVSLEWITTAPAPVIPLQNRNHETRAMLFSGSEDQSVRKWDVSQILKIQLEKQENRKEVEKEKEAVLEEGINVEKVAVAGVAAEIEDENVPPPPPPPSPPLLSEGIIPPEKEEEVEKEGEIISENTNIPSVSAAAVEKLTTASPSPSSSAHENNNKLKSGFGGASTSTTPLAAHQVSLGAKGVLPPSLPRAETISEQAPLDAALVSLASRVAARFSKIDQSVADEEPDYFATLGCIVDPLSAMPALHQASNSLLSGPSQRPAAARVLAQRAAAVSLWSGDVGSAIKVLVENDALTADFVSFSAAAGRGAWEAASRAYSFLLEERGEPHLAALHLASIGDPVSACRVYTRAGMVREAATLAIAKLPHKHPLVLETRAMYATQLQGRGDFERAAAQYIASGNWKKAVEMLQQRGTVDSLQTALEILSITQQRKEKEKRTDGSGENGNSIVETKEKEDEVEEDSFAFSEKEAKILKNILETSLSSLKQEQNLDTSTVSGKKSNNQPSSLEGQGEERRRRYSKTTCEEIKEEMAKRDNAWNQHFKLKITKQFPNLSVLLKDSS